jgi:hypothetical protein
MLKIPKLIGQLLCVIGSAASVLVVAAHPNQNDLDKARKIWDSEAANHKNFKGYKILAGGFLTDARAYINAKLREQPLSLNKPIEPVVAWDANRDHQIDYSFVLNNQASKKQSSKYATVLLLSKADGNYTVHQIYSDEEIPLFVMPLPNGDFETLRPTQQVGCKNVFYLDTLTLWNGYIINAPSDTLALQIDSVTYTASSPWGSSNTTTYTVRAGGASSRRAFNYSERLTRHYTIADTAQIAKDILSLLTFLNGHNALPYHSGCIYDATTHYLELFCKNDVTLSLSHYPAANSATIRAVHTAFAKLSSLPATLIYTHDIYKPKF